METAIPNQVNEVPTQTIVEGQEKKVQATQETSKEESKKEEVKQPEFMSEKFAALSKKEKAIVKARQEVSAKEAELNRRMKEMDEKIAKYERLEGLRANAKLDPDAYLSEAGLSYGELTERNLKGGIDPKAILEKTNQTIASFKKEQEEKAAAEKKAQEEAANREYQARLQSYAESLYDFVDQNKETFEFTHTSEQQPLVFDVVKAAAARKIELTPKEATEKVENYVFDKFKALANTKKGREWIQKEFAALLSPKEEIKPGSPTLSNSMAPSTQSPTRPLTDKERIRNAEIALKKSFGEI